MKLLYPSLAILASLAMTTSCTDSLTMQPCSKVLPAMMPAPMFMSQLSDGGVIAVDLESVLVFATSPVYENSLADKLTAFELKDVGECKAEILSTKEKVIYRILKGHTVADKS